MTTLPELRRLAEAVGRERWRVARVETKGRGLDIIDERCGDLVASVRLPLYTEQARHRARAALIAACEPLTILALVRVAEAAQAADACWDAGTQDAMKLIANMQRFMAELHAAIAALKPEDQG